MMGSAPWPAGRFLKDLMFFTPVGRWIYKRPEQDVGEAANRRAMESASPLVFVSGATGGVGRRVVQRLVEHGVRVRVLVRNLERAKTIMADQGIDLSRIDFIVSDLYNLQPEFFRGVDAVISATGVKIGPENDTPDRKLYSQGIVFYEPVVLEDTPRNVEFEGISNLARLSRNHFDEANVEPNHSVLPIVEFRDKAEMQKVWGIVDDVVMGGVSEGTLSLGTGDLDGSAVFSGTLRTENRGGFSSIRTLPFETPVDCSSFDGFQFRVKGDGKRYKFICRCDDKWDGVGFSFSFDTISGSWIDVRMPFSDLKPVFRAKSAPQVQFNPSSVRAFQVMLSKFEYDGELNPHFSSGPFELAFRSICAYSSLGVDPPTYPRFIHVSSAGTTRLFRPEEFPTLEDQPPALRMNDQLGRVMEWKLAGEDAIRQNLSNHSYVILRPCALTEEAPRGRSNLKFEQGDFLTGKVSRDDLADLIASLVVGSPVKFNTTFEVSDAGDSFLTLTSLKEDEEIDTGSRSFASFPFIPTETSATGPST